MDEIKFNGDKLFHIRRSKKISQEQLALGVGVSRQTIYSWETNQSLPDVEKISKICKILEINLSDIVDGVDEKNKNIQQLQIQMTQENSSKVQTKTKSKKKIIRIISILILVLVLSYITISTTKFIKLNIILSKWKKLDKINSYYIQIQEFSIDSSNNNDMFENFFREIYYHDNVLKIIWKDTKEKNINTIKIYDYKNGFKYMIDEKNKTYVVSKLLNDPEEKELTINFKDYFDISMNFFGNYAYCLKPSLKILSKKDNYEISLENNIKKSFNKETGLLEYEEVVESAYRQTRKYYEYELNTDKDFEVNLDEYTEVSP